MESMSADAICRVCKATAALCVCQGVAEEPNMQLNQVTSGLVAVQVLRGAAPNWANLSRLQKGSCGFRGFVFSEATPAPKVFPLARLQL